MIIESGANLVKFIQFADIFLYCVIAGKEWDNSKFATQVQHNEKQKPANQLINRLIGGMDGTRTRDPLRDRQVF